MLEIPILGLLWGLDFKLNVEFFFFFFFLILSISESFSFYLLVKNSFDFKLGFFSYFEYISGVSSGKTFSIQITIVPGNIVILMQKRTEKPSTNFTERFFSMVNCEFFIVISIYGSKAMQKFIFSGIKVEKMAFL